MAEISIIVPVYNTAEFLAKCIESILRQTYTQYELLLINDGSTDISGAICDEYAQKDDRIRVFHKKNGGVSSARNKGLDEAKGKWIAFADSDDTVKEQWLETFIHNSVGVDWIVQGFNIIYSPTILYRNKKQGSISGVVDSEGKGLDNLRDFVYNLAVEETLGYLWCKMFKKDIIEKYKLRFNVLFKIQEDEDFIFKYINHINSYRNVKNGYYNYNMPDFSNKYIIDNNCVKSIWISAKQFYNFHEKMSFFAKIYGHLYMQALVKMYFKRKTQKERIDNLIFYLKEFDKYELPPIGKNSKILSFLLLRKNLIISDFFYMLIFKSIKIIKY